MVQKNIGELLQNINKYANAIFHDGSFFLSGDALFTNDVRKAVLQSGIEGLKEHINELEQIIKG